MREGTQPILGKEATELFTLFHSLLANRQHAFRSDCRFFCEQFAPDISCLLSRSRHSCRFHFRPSLCNASTYLRPFAPRALPRFITTMDTLTPARRALRFRTPIFTGSKSAINCPLLSGPNYLYRFSVKPRYSKGSVEFFYASENRSMGAFSDFDGERVAVIENSAGHIDELPGY